MENKEKTNAGLPLFISPQADLAPKTLDHSIPGADSWFLVANVETEDKKHRFALLIHYVTRGAGEERSTVTIMDITADRYMSNITGKGAILETPGGFEFQSANIRWRAGAQNMEIESKASDDSFEVGLKADQKGNVFAYNATGIVPLFGKEIVNWEYAFPTMEICGTLSIGKERYEIKGTGWFDRQWGPLPIESLLHGSARWLWVAARLSNGDVMALWSTKDKEYYNWVTIQHPDGSYIVTKATTVLDDYSDVWKSEKSGCRWPSSWKVEISDYDMELGIRLTNLNQEVLPPEGDTVAGPTLEAAVNLCGTLCGSPITGEGFMELVSSTDF